jgi:hypothetical protein
MDGWMMDDVSNYMTYSQIYLLLLLLLLLQNVR